MTAFLGGARRRRAYPTSITSTTGGGGGGSGIAVPQLPDTTGAFAYYAAQENVGVTPLVDSIGGRNLTGGVNTQTPHQLFSGRKMLRPGTAWSSAVDAAWFSADVTIEMIFLPFTAGTGPLATIVNNGTGQENIRIHWASGQIGINHFGSALTTTAGNPFYPGPASTVGVSAPYLLRVERDSATKVYRVYKDGALENTLSYVAVPPVNADQFVWGVGSAFLSDIIVWKTGAPPVSAEDQARRVKPYIFT